MEKEEGQKVRIGGIKFSEELVQVIVARTSPDDATIYQLLQLIAEQNINISFLCHSVITSKPESVFCIDRVDFVKFQQVLKVSSLKNEQINIIPSVGTITLFPHRNSFNLLGRILSLFGQNDFPIHSFSTSISAIAFNTEYSLLENIAEKLQQILALPENHAPFRQDFLVKQIDH